MSALILPPILVSVPLRSLLMFDLWRTISSAEMKMENMVKESPCPKGSLPSIIKHMTKTMEPSIEPNEI